MSRPVATLQSALQFPLNHILGAETNVRVLRAFFQAGSPLTRARLADVAQISMRGVLGGLNALVDAGVVEPIGSGRGAGYRLREQHPLLEPLRALYRAEQSRVRGLWSRLTKIVGELDEPPISVWVEGAVARGSDELNEPIRLVVLAKVKSLASIKEALSESIGGVEREFDVMIEIVPRSRADLTTPAARRELEKIVLIFGPEPRTLLEKPESSRGRRTHAEIDAHLRRIGTQLAQFLREDPTLVAKAAEHLEHRLGDEGQALDLREWLRIFRNNSAPQIARLLESNTERAARLRQSPILISVLSETQRKKLESVR